MARQRGDPADDDRGADALAASDEGERMLREGRYGNVSVNRPSAGEQIRGLLKPGRKWIPHLNGWACARCGPTMHARSSVHRHDWWHRWLDELFAMIGDDVDRLEGEVTELRAECAARIAEADQRADTAVQQVALMTRLLGPLLTDLLEREAAEGGPE
jgi:hypothetical protein